MSLSSFTLRLIALAAMVTDHAGLALFPGVGLFRCVGRIAFPIYCFLIAQGFRYTRDIHAYGRRLLLAAILSEIPFDLLIFSSPASGMEQNVLFSLLLGLLALHCVKEFQDQPVYAFAAVMLICLGAMAAQVSFGWLGVALCLGAYFAEDSKPRLLAYLGGALLLYCASLLLSGVATSWVLTSLCALLALPMLLCYNGRRGLKRPWLTLAFYAAYPLHILLLLLIRTMRLIPPYFLH